MRLSCEPGRKEVKLKDNGIIISQNELNFKDFEESYNKNVLQVKENIGIMCLFDLTDMKTLFDFDILFEKYLDKTQNIPPMLFVGTKYDLVKEEDIDHHMIENFAKKYNTFYSLISSKTRFNVEETFLKMAQIVDEFHGKSDTQNQSQKEKVHKSDCKIL